MYQGKNQKGISKNINDRFIEDFASQFVNHCFNSTLANNLKMQVNIYYLLCNCTKQFITTINNWKDNINYSKPLHLL